MRNYRETWDKANYSYSSWRDMKGVKLVDEDKPSYASMIGTGILIVVCVVLFLFI